jgi:hypothetical protein
VESADGFAEVTPEHVGIKPCAQLGQGFDIAYQIEISSRGNLAESGTSDGHDW